jgi:CHAT domain-containing protein
MWVPLESTLEDDSAGHLERDARDFRKALVTAASWPVRLGGTDVTTRQARDIWSGWIASLTPHLDGITHLVVLPPRPLLGVPIEALIGPDSVCLGDRYAVTYAPSATIYAWLEEQALGLKSGIPGSALLVGDPMYASEEPLKLARREIQRIASMIPNSEVLLGGDASERKIREMAESGELRRFDVIHIAAHAFADWDHPERSALMLSQVDKSDPIDVIMKGKPAFDGLITAEEIVRQFEFHPKLVTLSACRTAMANAPGDGFLDLAHAFLLSGTRSVLVSLWNVSDDATSLLMGRFYENMTGSYLDDRGAAAPAIFMDKAHALKEARRWLRDYEDEAGDRPFQHPVYWAGFVLIGGLN